MKPNPIPVLAGLLLLSHCVLAQDSSSFRLQLKSGVIIPEKNITSNKIDQINRIAYRAEGKSFAVIQFDVIPGIEERKELERAGIQLLDYVPNNAYSATITGTIDKNLLVRLKARAVIDLTPDQKMQPALSRGIIPPWAVVIGGTVDVWISFPK